MSIAALEVDALTGAGSGASQYVLMVDFETQDGQRWSAVGGGDTLADAIRFARDSCPSGRDWHPVGWDDLHGD
jgi:hypothetical protein